MEINRSDDKPSEEHILKEREYQVEEVEDDTIEGPVENNIVVRELAAMPDENVVENINMVDYF